MFKTHVEVLRIAVFSDIFCNKCGRSCSAPDSCGPEHAEVKADWGYGSNKDGQRCQAHLCEPCCDELFSQFVIPVRVAEAPLVDPLDEHAFNGMKDDHERLTTWA